MSDPFAGIGSSLHNDPFAGIGNGSVNTTSTVPVNDEAAKIDAIRQHAEDTPNSTLGQFGLAATQAAIGLPAAILRTTAKVITPLQDASNKLDEFVASLTPGAHAATSTLDANLQGIAQATGDAVGTVIGMPPLFKGASLAAEGAGAILERVAPKLAADALSTVARAGRATELITKQFVTAEEAARLGNAVTMLPKSIVAGLGLQGAIDPNSLSTPKGFAMGLGMSALGAMMEAKNMTSSIARTAKEIDPLLPDYEQEAQAAIMQRADVKVPDLVKAMQDFRTNFIDRLNPVKLFSDVVTGSQDMYQRVKLLVNGSSASISEMVNHGTTGEAFKDFTNKTPGLKQIYAPLSKAESARGGALDRLLLARRILDPNIQDKIAAHVANGGIERDIVPLSTESATKIVANAADHITAAADQVNQYIAAVKEYGVKAGVLNQDVLDQLDPRNPNYVPLKREIDKIADPTLRPINNTFGPGKIIQNLFGSEKDVLSIGDNVRDFTNTVMRTADRNGVGSELLNATLNNKAGADAMGVSLASAWDNPQLYQQAQGIQKALKAQGIDINDQTAQRLVAQYGKSFDSSTNILTVQTPKGLQRLQLSSDLAKMYQSLAPKHLNFIQNMLALPTRAITTGVTSTLDFTGITFIRNAFVNALQGDHGFNWGRDNLSELFPKLATSFKNSGRGLVESIKDGQQRADWMSAKGGFGDIARTAGDFNNVFNDIRPMSKGQLVGNIILHPIDALRMISRPFVEAAHLGEFISNREMGASLEEAAIASRNGPIDFGQRGASMQALSQIVAFLNPAIQHLDASYQNLMRDPIGLGAKGLASISIPSALLWYANKDDKEINDLRKTPAGNLYWFVRAGDNVIKIPKPFLYGQVFGTSMESALDTAYNKDPQSVSRVMQGLLGQWPSVIPNAMSIPLQLKMNKDITTDGNIIPDGLKNVDPQTQFTLGTSALAQHISKSLYNISGGIVNVSPIQLDWIAKNTGGNIARDIISATGEKSSLADYPFFRRFVAQYPTMGVEPIQTFYDNANKFNGIVQTVDRMAKSNAPTDTIGSYLNSHVNEFAYAGLYAEGQKQMQDIQKTIWQVHTGPFAEETKKQLVQQLTRSAIELARGINQSIQH